LAWHLADGEMQPGARTAEPAGAAATGDMVLNSLL
jgi:hypothetical protein